MTTEQTRVDETFEEAAERVGHRLIRRDDGSIDMFRVDFGFHNGPECELCGVAWCEHCVANEKIRPCAFAPQRAEQEGS